MVKTFVTLCVLVVVSASVSWAKDIDWRARRAALGHQEKLRVMVDTVLIKHGAGGLTAEDMDEICEAGFNVVAGYIGTDPRLDKLLVLTRQRAEMCRQRGMFYMTWIEGYHYPNRWTTGETGPKMVGANGKTARIFSPNADEFWEWLTELMLGQARVSTEFPCMIGAFFDFEGYAIGEIGGNNYPLSYDELIMKKFAEARGIELPSLAPAQRYPWLKEHGLHEQFEQFQINYWRQRCRQVRQEVDRINPAFQIIVYPIPSSLFTDKAFVPEMATEQAPLICGDPISYARGPGVGGLWLSEEDGLLMNRYRLTEDMKLDYIKNIPHLLMGGIDPICAGADPEFCGKNAVAISQITNGYWVFYEGPKYETTHKDYFRWFKKANQAIAAGDYTFWQHPRQGPDPKTISANPNVKFTANQFTTTKPKLGQLGLNKRFLKQLNGQGSFEVHQLESLSFNNLRRYDVIVLQNLAIDFPSDHLMVKALRRYVETGGSLFLTARSGWYLNRVCSEIALRGGDGQTTKAPYIRDNKYVVVKAHPALGTVSVRTQFTGEASGHRAFAAGPKGATVIEDTEGRAVYIVGQMGKGRVVVSGSYFGDDNPLTGVEKGIFFSILDWLDARPEKPIRKRHISSGDKPK